MRVTRDPAKGLATTWSLTEMLHWPLHFITRRVIGRALMGWRWMRTQRARHNLASLSTTIQNRE